MQTTLGTHYLRYLTVLFCVSLFFLGLHVIDDALTTGEPAEAGVSIPEFLFYAALIYLIIPPFGVVFARQGRWIGLVIVMLYGLQVLYGAGLNHLRHMFGDFSGSQMLPRFLGTFGIRVADIHGYGFGSVVMGMLGLGTTPPHTHTFISTLIVFINIPLNLVLLTYALLALREMWRARNTSVQVAKMK